MKITKIIAAALVGTTFMTLYSYAMAKKENEKYLEPELLNALIDGSDNLPDVDDEKSNAAGWLAHYGVGLIFVLSYYILWKQSLKSPSIVKGLILGAGSGVVAIIAWKIMFRSNDDPPHNDRYGYYRQLFFAHLIFSTTALYGYKLPEYIKGS